MDFLAFIIGGLATWRVSYMLVKETGPLAIFARFRAYLASKQEKIGGLFDMLSCVGCTSVYVGFVTALELASGPIDIIMYTLSFSAVAVLIERLTSK